MKVESKLVTKTVTVEEKKYIAEDGKVFESAESCVSYERETIWADKFEKLKNIETCESAKGFPPFDGGMYNEDYYYWWFRPKTMEEAELLNDIFAADNRITEDDLGDWICIESYEDKLNFENYYYGKESSWVWNLEDSIKYCTDMLEKLGYKVTIEKEDK